MTLDSAVTFLLYVVACSLSLVCLFLCLKLVSEFNAAIRADKTLMDEIIKARDYWQVEALKSYHEEGSSSNSSGGDYGLVTKPDVDTIKHEGLEATIEQYGVDVMQGAKDKKE